MRLFSLFLAFFLLFRFAYLEAMFHLTEPRDRDG
jgi:hypothetical protein